jgi:hypothetical protein
VDVRLGLIAQAEADCEVWLRFPIVAYKKTEIELAARYGRIAGVDGELRSAAPELTNLQGWKPELLKEQRAPVAFN